MFTYRTGYYKIISIKKYMTGFIGVSDILILIRIQILNIKYLQ
jgi:hypothetical protein